MAEPAGQTQQVQGMVERNVAAEADAEALGAMNVDAAMSGVLRADAAEPHLAEAQSAEPSATSLSQGTDATSRAERRAWRERLNDEATRKVAVGVIATLIGGFFWGFSGTSASLLFSHYQVDTFWLLSVRQIFAGLLFMAVVLVRDRDRLIRLWTTPAHIREQLLFTIFGLLLNQFGYLMAVRLTNAGTATVLQCLQLVIIMIVTCLRRHRSPRRRELAGLVLALLGTFLIATGGNISQLSISPAGLAVGLLAALGAALTALIPTTVLPEYGSSVVTGSAMVVAGIFSCACIQPWNNPPALDASGIGALAIFIVVGSFLSYFLYMQGVKDLGGMRASMLGTIEPVSAAVTSALLLGTVFAPTDIVGFVAIIVMVFLTV